MEGMLTAIDTFIWVLAVFLHAKIEQRATSDDPCQSYNWRNRNRVVFSFVNLQRTHIDSLLLACKSESPINYSGNPKKNQHNSDDLHIISRNTEQACHHHRLSLGTYD